MLLSWEIKENVAVYQFCYLWYENTFKTTTKYWFCSSHQGNRRSFSSSKQMNHRTFTDVKRRVSSSGEVIDVWDPKRLDGHRADAEQQLSAAHQQPQGVGVGQTPRLVPTARLWGAGVPLKGADVLWVWRRGGRRGGGEEGGQLMTISGCTCLISWSFSDTTGLYLEAKIKRKETSWR